LLKQYFLIDIINNNFFIDFCSYYFLIQISEIFSPMLEKILDWCKLGFFFFLIYNGVIYSQNT